MPLPIARWDALLRDPCAAELAPPCYAGTDTGYLVRTVDYVVPSFTVATGVVGAAARLDGYLQFTPFNVSTTTGLLVGGASAGGALPALAQSGFSNFITAATPVRRYRPVAACIKWIPDGAFGTRAGTVGLGYSPGVPVLAGSTITISAALAMCQMKAVNGSEAHEVRWLPAAEDEQFTTTGATALGSVGSNFIAFSNIDGVYTTTTTAAPSGRFEITSVWEWTPNATTGISQSPAPPTGYTTQQVLSTIQDMGSYLFYGIRTANRLRTSIGPMLAGAGFGGRTIPGNPMLVRY